MYQDLLGRLRGAELIVLDGGVGTELERRGAIMDAGSWCGSASSTHAKLLQAIHADYISVGADVITANTYASSPIMLSQSGHAHRHRELNLAAVEAALEAKAQSGRDDVIVAGSLSHMVPMQSHSDQPQEIECEREAFSESVEAHASLLAELGCELILLEMMHHPVRSRLTYEAACKTGLPLWVGFSVKRREGGRLESRTSGCSLDQLFDFPTQAVDVMGVMHSPSELAAPAVDHLRTHWQGPVMVYPDSGYFKMPHWQFENIISPQAYLKFARQWFNSGVQIMGGCCGLGPEHIAALQALRD